VQLAAARPEREEELRARVALAERRRRTSLRTTANLLGVPEDEDLRAVALDDAAPETPAMRAVREALAWRGTQRRGCVLVVGGERGAGKSAALAHALVRCESSALFVPAVTIGATPRNGYSENAHAWDRWLSVSVLAVDDVGTEGGDPEALAALLWQRYDAGRATLASTNLARSEFVERYLTGQIGARVADRLIHAQGRAIVGPDGRRVIGPGGQAWFVAVPGGSLRRVEARLALRGGA
jgi:DNA replication protein DnaC